MEPAATRPAAPGPLPRIERRILGVLLEKAIATPDNYPLSANSVVAGCNQKSNRDPVVEYPAEKIDEALLALKDRGLVLRVLPATGRVDRWKHDLKEKWGLAGAERAVLAELLLRGPQAEGALRANSSRLVEVPSLDELRAILEGLASRGFVKRLSAEGRRRGVVWTHLFFSERELSEYEQQFRDDDVRSSDSGPRASEPEPNRREAGPSLADRVARLEAEVARLAEQLTQLRDAAKESSPST